MSRLKFYGSLGAQLEPVPSDYNHNNRNKTALTACNYPAQGAMKQAKRGCRLNDGKTCFECKFPDCQIKEK